jgi:short-subunit dehydrogenase
MSTGTGRGILIVGASAGLGHGISCGLPVEGDCVWLVSRRRPPSLQRGDGIRRIWIAADLADPEQIARIKAGIGEAPLHGLIFCAATWESDEDIENVDSAEIYRILSVNISSFISVTKSLGRNLRAAGNAKVIAIGSTYGLDNGPGDRAAYAASKFGLRGAVGAFRTAFRPDKVAVTCISPGAMASEIDFDDGRDAALEQARGTRIPLTDMIALIDTVMAMSPAACVKEVIIPAMTDLDA